MMNKTIRIHCFPEPITVAEIKAVISENGIKPSDLFGMSDLVSDPVVTGYVADEKKNASAGVFANLKRTDKKFDEEKEAWTKREKELTDENMKLKRDNAKLGVGNLFNKAITSRKLDEKQKKYIEARIPKFDVSDPEKIEDEFNTFLDDQIETFKTDASVFGVDIGGGDGGEPKGGEPSNQGNATGDDIFTKPLD